MGGSLGAWHGRLDCHGRFTLCANLDLVSIHCNDSKVIGSEIAHLRVETEFWGSEVF